MIYVNGNSNSISSAYFNTRELTYNSSPKCIILKYINLMSDCCDKSFVLIMSRKFSIDTWSELIWIWFPIWKEPKTQMVSFDWPVSTLPVLNKYFIKKHDIPLPPCIRTWLSTNRSAFLLKNEPTYFSLM